MNTDARGIDSPKGGGEDATAKPQEPGPQGAPKQECAPEHTEERQEGVPAECDAVRDLKAFEAAGFAMGKDHFWRAELSVAQLLELAATLRATHPTPAQAAPQAETPAGPEDWHHLKRYGYAPGDYMGTCHRCRTRWDRQDKRATTCRQCAEEMHAAALVATPQAPQAPAGVAPTAGRHLLPVQIPDGRIVKMRKCDIQGTDLMAFCDFDALPPQVPQATAGVAPTLTDEQILGFVAGHDQRLGGHTLPTILKDLRENSLTEHQAARHLCTLIRSLAATRAEPVFLVATGETRNGRELYERFEGAPPPLCDFETLYAAPQVARAEPAGGREEAKSLAACVADALRPFLQPGQKVIWRQPFRWFDDGGVMSNHYDGMSLQSLAAEFGYEVIEDCGCAGIIAIDAARASLAAPPTSEASRD